MYAVIELAGKQFRVAKGESILVDQPEDAPLSPRVLMVVDGNDVITDRAKLDKVTVATKADGTVTHDAGRVMKFKPKQGRTSKRTIGHRRRRTRVQIGEIKV